MPSQEVFIMQAYKRDKRRLTAAQPVQCKTAAEAMQRLTRLQDRGVVTGAIAYGIMIDVETGDTDDEPRTLGRFGELPRQFGDES